MRPIITITGPQAKAIHEILNEPGDEKRYIGTFTKDGRQLIQVIDANDTVHNFDLEGVTIDVKYRRYHNSPTGINKPDRKMVDFTAGLLSCRQPGNTQ
jgi:hypothetical protein